MPDPVPILDPARRTPLLYRNLKLDWRPALNDLAGFFLAAKFGDWKTAAQKAVGLLTRVKIETDPHALVGLLVQKALLEGLYSLIAERELGYTGDQPPVTESLAAEIERILAETPWGVDSAFLRHPERLPLLVPIGEAFRDWLDTCGLSEAEARFAAQALPFHFALACVRELGRDAARYEPVVKLLNAPALPAVEQEWRWLDYAWQLQTRVTLPIFGEPFGLRDVWVDLRAWHAAPGVAKRRQRDRVGEAPPEEPSKQVVRLMAELTRWVEAGRQGDPLRVISGGPGSGKSSFARMFAAALAARGEPRVLLIPLHRFELGGNLEQAVAAFVREEDLGLGNPLDPEEKARRLLIFDGLDELQAHGEGGEQLAGQFVQHVLNILNNRNARETRLQVLITGRDLAIQAHAAAFTALGPILHLLPYAVPSWEREGYVDPESLLDADGREEWWQNYGRARAKPYAGLPGELRRKDLDEITAQPLLNYLVARSWEAGALDFSREVSRNAIYADLLSQVYERPWREAQQAKGHPGTGKLTPDAFVRLLEEIALVVWHGNGRTATRAAIQARCEAAGLGELLTEFIGQARDPKGLTRLLTAFYFRAQRVGLAESETIEFTHKSFGEYLLARRLVTGLEEMEELLQPRRSYGPRPTAQDALAHWVTLTGPVPLTPDLLPFLRAEVALRGPELAASWQALLVQLITAALQEGMPMERFMDPKPTVPTAFRQMEEQARNAETALLAALDACARARAALLPPGERAAAISQIAWPTPYSFAVWLSRLRGEQLDRYYAAAGESAPLPLQCLSYLDLGGAFLDSANLREASLVGARLAGARLAGAFLAGARLVRANLARADLDGASLAEARLEEARLAGARLVRTNLDGACLDRANLNRANLNRADLDGASLLGAGLLEANLAGARLVRANLAGARLVGANLAGASLAGAILDGAHLDGANLDGATFTDRTRWPANFSRRQAEAAGAVWAAAEDLASPLDPEEEAAGGIALIAKEPPGAEP